MRNLLLVLLGLIVGAGGFYVLESHHAIPSMAGSRDGLGKGTGGGTMKQQDTDKKGFTCYCTQLDDTDPTSDPDQESLHYTVNQSTTYWSVQADGSHGVEAGFDDLKRGVRIIIKPTSANSGIAMNVLIVNEPVVE